MLRETLLGARFPGSFKLRSNKTLIKMMREAIEKYLHFPFLAMTPPGDIPQSPQVIELLEEGAEKYPTLRSEFLRSIHMLGFLMNRWYLLEPTKI